MSLESLVPSISDLGNASVIVLAIAAALFYFGKIVSDVKVEPSKTEDYYVNGLIFSLFFLVFPGMLVWLIVAYAKITLPIWLSIIFQVAIVFVLDGILFFKIGRISPNKFRQRIIKVFENVQKLTDDMIKKHTERLIKSNEALQTATARQESIFIRVSRGFYLLPERIDHYIGNSLSTLFFLSTISLMSLYSVVVSTSILSFVSIFVYIITFLNVTFLAMVYGYVHIQYPEAEILLDNGEKIKGKLSKIGKYVSIVDETNDRHLLINANKIMLIDENLFPQTPDDKGEKAS